MQENRAAIYARFSTDLQNERSVDDQIAVCREFAARNGLVVAGEYHDKARSGASIFGRDGLLGLMEDARAGKFKTVIVEALDRLSRDQEDLAGLHKRLAFAGVEILAIHDGKTDAIQVGIRGLVSTLFLADLKNKIRRGMTGVVREGRHAGGKAYGYQPTPGQPGVMQIFDPEADVVRRIYRETIEGKTSREIAAGLNRDKILPPRGTQWNASTINGSAQRGYGIVRNPLYAGEIVWNRVHMVRDPETGKRISRPNPESEYKRASAPHLAIVDRETYDRALALLEGKSRRGQGGSNTRSPKRLLSGILRCGHCGGGMSIHDHSGKSVRIRCSRSTQSGVCGNDRRYRLDKIERAVINGLKEQLSAPEILVEYVRAYREERRLDADTAVRERASIERRVADIGGQLDRLMQAMTRGVLPIEAVEAQYGPLKAEKDALEKKLDAIPAAPIVELHPATITRYKNSIDALAERLTSLDRITDSEVHIAFRDLVDHVTVIDREDGGVEAEIVGHIAALVGSPAEMLGGRMVAGEGLEPPTRGL
ncbi:recombinase family protein [Agrobacterium pusense]|uniref:recombinase family protein n=1 Tax=Agrobacterium pusense TaxID=648995 RepID=UPI000D1BF66D|nr:recombinase family protein [Agrobacterium pusense]